MVFDLPWPTTAKTSQDGVWVLTQDRRSGPDDMVILDREAAVALARAILVASEQETA